MKGTYHHWYNPNLIKLNIDKSCGWREPDYGGISASRLEILEERLRDDVRTELDKFGGRLLLHTEAHDGTVIPIWEEVGPEAVEAMREVMVQRSQMPDGTRVLYKRIPITSERPPDFTDLSDMMEVVTRLHSSNTPIILNCQLGRGRSTVASVWDWEECFWGLWELLIYIFFFFR